MPSGRLRALYNKTAAVWRRPRWRRL